MNLVISKFTEPFQNFELSEIRLKAAFAVVPTDKICGWSLSSKISVDMNSIFMKLCHMTNVS